MGVFLSRLVMAASGRVSKTKVTALILAVLAVLDSFGVFHATPEQRETVLALAGALLAFFLRDGMDNL